MKSKIQYYYLMSFLTTLREWHIRRALRAVKKTCGPGQPLKILDAGCGFGQYTVFMHKLFNSAHIDALDGDKRRIDKLAKIIDTMKVKDISLIHKDLQELSPLMQYDLILCSAVLEYIPNDKGAVDRMTQALNLSGIMVLYQPVTDNDCSSSKFQREVADKIAEKQLPLINRYTEEGLIQLVKVPGLKLQKLIYTHGFWGRLGANIERLFFRSNRFRFPFSVLYLIFIHPIAMLFMLADYALPVRNGAGMIMILKKENT